MLVRLSDKVENISGQRYTARVVIESKAKEKVYDKTLAGGCL